MSLSKKVIYPFTFSVCTFCIPRDGIDKNAQSRRISESSPYKRTAETDFDERKSEYNKTQEIRERISCHPYKSILLKILSFHESLYPKKLFTHSLFRSALF